MLAACKQRRALQRLLVHTLQAQHRTSGSRNALRRVSFAAAVDSATLLLDDRQCMNAEWQSRDLQAQCEVVEQSRPVGRSGGGRGVCG